MKTLADFEVWIDEPPAPPADGRAPAYPVTVYSSPAGPAQGQLKLDLSDPTFASELVQVTSIDPDTQIRKAFGGRLFDALFDGAVRDAWRTSTGRVDGKEFDGLRLRLTINVPGLSALPWELLWDASNDAFLAVASNLALARYLPVPEPPFLPAPQKVRILVVVESPPNTPGLPPVEQAEVTSLEAELQGIGDAVEYELLENANAAEIQNALRREFHVLHFLGHGRSGQLVLPDDAGRWRGIDDREFAQLVSGRGSLRLIVLNACHSAQAQAGGIFAGVGPALVRQRMPAVIAMQYPFVQLDTAAKFSRVFYRALADGLPVDIAVNEGRQLLAAKDLGDRDWSTPVLYTGTRSGRILNFADGGEVELAWKSLRAAARSNGTLASFAELSQRLRELNQRHATLRAWTTLVDLLRSLRVALGPAAAVVEKPGGISTSAQFNAVREAWKQISLHTLQAARAFAADRPEQAHALRPLFETAGLIDDAVEDAAYGAVEREVKELNRRLAEAESDARRSVDSAFADIVSFTDQTLGRLMA